MLDKNMSGEGDRTKQKVICYSHTCVMQFMCIRTCMRLGTCVVCVCMHACVCVCVCESLHMYLLQIHIFSELHVFGMDAEDLQAPSGIGYANVHLSVKATKSPEGGVNAIGTVGGCHDNDMGSLLQPVHKSQELGHDSSLHFTMGLSSGGRGGGVNSLANCNRATSMVCFLDETEL